LGSVSVIWLLFVQVEGFFPFLPEFSCNGPLRSPSFNTGDCLFALPAKLWKKESTEVIVRNFLLWKKNVLLKAHPVKSDCLAFHDISKEKIEEKKREQVNSDVSWSVDCVMPRDWTE